MSINSVKIECDYCGKVKDAGDAICHECYKDFEKQVGELEDKVRNLESEIASLRDRVAFAEGRS